MSGRRAASTKPPVVAIKKAAPSSKSTLFGTVKPSTTVAAKKAGISKLKAEEQSKQDLYELDSEFKRDYKDLYKESLKRMGEPTHPGMRPVEIVLRVFDATDEYGPVTGQTREERFHRAEKFGLNPNPAILDIILSTQGASVVGCFVGV